MILEADTQDGSQGGTGLKRIVAKLTQVITDDEDLQAFVREQLRMKHQLQGAPPEEDEAEHTNFFALETHVISHVLNCVIASLDHSYGGIRIGAEPSDDVAPQ